MQQKCNFESLQCCYQKTFQHNSAKSRNSLAGGKNKEPIQNLKQLNSLTT